MKCSQLLRRLNKSGVKVLRQTSGSHVILIRPDGDGMSFPDHGSKEMAQGTAHKILKWAGLK